MHDVWCLVIEWVFEWLRNFTSVSTEKEAAHPLSRQIVSKLETKKNLDYLIYWLVAFINITGYENQTRLKPTKSTSVYFTTRETDEYRSMLKIPVSHGEKHFIH